MFVTQANSMGLVSEDHTWILPSYYNPNWWRLPSNESVFDTRKGKCSNEVIEDILESVIFIRNVKFPPMVTTKNVVSYPGPATHPCTRKVWSKGHLSISWRMANASASFLCTHASYSEL